MLQWILLSLVGYEILAVLAIWGAMFIEIAVLKIDKDKVFEEYFMKERKEDSWDLPFAFYMLLFWPLFMVVWILSFVWDGLKILTMRLFKYGK